MQGIHSRACAVWHALSESRDILASVDTPFGVPEYLRDVPPYAVHFRRGVGIVSGWGGKDSSLWYALVFCADLGRSTEARIGDIVSATVGGGHAKIPTRLLFSHLPVRGNAVWTPQRLAWMGLLMAWDEGQTLGARWDHACSAAHDLHAHWKLGESYSGFTQALLREASRLVPAITQRFRQAMQALPRRWWTCAGWEAFAVDGSRLEAPHTAANESGLGCAGKDKTAPQVFLTTICHLGLGLPWDFRVGPGTDSERHHAADMVDQLPSGALLVADAGFPGYGLCQQLLCSGRSFLLRVGGNIRLLKELGYYERERGDTVYLWPQKRQKAGHKPLVLRLIRLREGKQTVYLVTDVLDHGRLTKEQARRLYRARWGEEVFFRSYKQTLARRKLLSRTPATCLAESQWTLLGLWLLGLMSVSEIAARGGDPKTWSVAGSRDLVRQALRDKRPRRCRRRPLRELLARAVRDTYEREGTKQTRNYPRKKKEKPPGPPKIEPPTPTEIKQAARLRLQNIERKRAA